MLQEDFSAPIVSQACLLSAFKYAVSLPDTDPEEWVSEAERVRDLEIAEQEKEMMAAAGGDDDDDEKKVTATKAGSFQDCFFNIFSPNSKMLKLNIFGNLKAAGNFRKINKLVNSKLVVKFITSGCWLIFGKIVSLGW